MSPLRILSFASILICLTLLGLPFAQLVAWFGLGLVGLIALLWGWQLFRPRQWIGELALAGSLVAAALVVLVNPPFAPAAFLSAVVALVAWDLSSFLERARGALPGAQEYQRMERVHLQRLFEVTLVGLAFGGLALTFHLNVPFAVAVLVAVIWFVCLSRLLRQMRRENPE